MSENIILQLHRPDHCLHIAYFIRTNSPRFSDITCWSVTLTGFKVGTSRFFLILPMFLILRTDLKNLLLNTKAQYQNSRNQETHADTDTMLKESEFQRNNN